MELTLARRHNCHPVAYLWAALRCRLLTLACRQEREGHASSLPGCLQAKLSFARTTLCLSAAGGGLVCLLRLPLPGASQPRW